MTRSKRTSTMDRLTKKKRSWLMSRVRGVDTTPELLVRTLVRQMGHRFASYSQNLPGRPDLIFRRKKMLIFVHGCFWHGHANCQKGRLPKSNRAYWSDKVIKNRARDRRVVRQLRRLGWKSLTIWACQLSDRDKVEKRIERFLK
jgi:DNA mismatch endonuclease (patch repair protein)